MATVLELAYFTACLHLRLNGGTYTTFSINNFVSFQKVSCLISLAIHAWNIDMHVISSTQDGHFLELLYTRGLSEVRDLW